MPLYHANFCQLGINRRNYENGRKRLKLQVAVKPGPIGKRPKQKRPAAEYPSTNISSPARAPPKRSIRDYTYDEPAGNATASRQRKPKPLSRQDNFNFPDDPDDEDYDDGDDFEPVRDAQPSKPKRNRTLGPPITVDERIAGLPDWHRDILEHFVTNAKKTAKDIQIQMNIRNQPFSDTVLREMGLDLPKTLDDLKRISGVNTEMADRYGRRFLALVAEIRQMMYGDNSPAPKKPVSRRPIIQDDDDEDDDEPVLQDPNHHLVIDLLSEDENNDFPQSQQPGPEEYEEDEPDYEDLDMYDDDEVQVSHYFNPPSPEPEVAEFRRKMSQVEAVRPSAPSSVRGQGSSRGTRGRGFRGKKRLSQRRSSTGPAAGVTKRGTAKKTVPKKASNTSAKRPSDGGGSSRGGRGSGAGSSTGWFMSAGIKAMPS